MKVKNIVSNFVLFFALTFVVSAVVNFLWNLIFHGAAAVSWETSFRLAIILGIVLTWTHGRK